MASNLEIQFWFETRSSITSSIKSSSNITRSLSLFRNDDLLMRKRKKLSETKMRNSDLISHFIIFWEVTKSETVTSCWYSVWFYSRTINKITDSLKQKVHNVFCFCSSTSWYTFHWISSGNIVHLLLCSLPVVGNRVAWHHFAWYMQWVICLSTAEL